MTQFSKVQPSICHYIYDLLLVKIIGIEKSSYEYHLNIDDFYKFNTEKNMNGK